PDRRRWSVLVKDLVVDPRRSISESGQAAAVSGHSRQSKALSRRVAAAWPRQASNLPRLFGGLRESDGAGSGRFWPKSWGNRGTRAEYRGQAIRRGSGDKQL